MVRESAIVCFTVYERIRATCLSFDNIIIIMEVYGGTRACREMQK